MFHLDSVGSNMTTLWAAEAGLYVGIDNRGNIITSVSTSLFCHFHRLNKASIDIFSITNIDRTATFKIRKKIKWLFTVAFPQRKGDTVSVILNAVEDGRTTTACDHMISILCRTVLVCLSLFTNNGFQIHFQATKISACTLRESLDTEFFNSFAMEFSPRRLHWLSISAQGKVRSSILTSSRNVQFITKPLH